MFSWLRKSGSGDDSSLQKQPIEPEEVWPKVKTAKGVIEQIATQPGYYGGYYYYHLLVRWEDEASLEAIRVEGDEAANLEVPLAREGDRITATWRKCKDYREWQLSVKVHFDQRNGSHVE